MLIKKKIVIHCRSNFLLFKDPLSQVTLDHFQVLNEELSCEIGFPTQTLLLDLIFENTPICQLSGLQLDLILKGLCSLMMETYFEAQV